MPRSRMLKFSLRTLLILVTLAGIASAAAVKWVHYGHQFERDQKYCDELIRSLGGSHTLWIERDVPRTGFHCGTYPRPEGLEFVVDRRTTGLARLYPGGLREITAVYITSADWSRSGSPEREAVFRRLAEIKSLSTVVCSLGNMSPADIAPLCELPRLKSLTLRSLAGESEDETLAALGRMSQLRELSIELPHSNFHHHRWKKLHWGGLSVDELLAAEPLASKTQSTAHDRSSGRARFTYECRATDLAPLSALPNLRKLELRHAVIVDSGLGSLAALEELTMSQVILSSDGFRELAKCRQLEELTLFDTKLGKNGAACIGVLPNLRKLNLYEDVDDEAVRAICAQRSIEELNLSHCDKLTRSGLLPLRAMPLVRLELSLSGRGSPEFLAELPTITTVRDLTIDSYLATDYYLPVLFELKQLDNLTLGGTEDAGFTAAQLAALQAALPNTKINATPRGGSAATVPTTDNSSSESDADTTEGAPATAAEPAALSES